MIDDPVAHVSPLQWSFLEGSVRLVRGDGDTERIGGVVLGHFVVHLFQVIHDLAILELLRYLFLNLIEVFTVGVLSGGGVPCGL